MTEMPSPVEIDPATHRKLLQANEKLQAIQQMMAMFQAQCEQRMLNARAEAREAWEEIKAAHPGLDLNNVAWEPALGTPAIVPTQMRLAPQSNPRMTMTRPN